MSTFKNIDTLLLAFILLISLCFSCNFGQKESTKKNIIQVDYYVRYLQSDKQLKTNISFAEVDSTKRIMPKKMEEVLFANNVLSGKKVGNQYRYQLEKQMPFAESYSLTYRQNQIEIDSVSIRMQPINDFAIKKGKVSKTAGTNITFEGTLASTEETLVLLFSDRNNKTATIKIDNHSVNSPITILPEQVSHLTVGTGNVYIVKKQTNRITSEGVEWTGLTEYYSTVKTIEIIE